MKIYQLLKLVSFIVVLSFICSCASQKKIEYFQNKGNTTSGGNTIGQQNGILPLELKIYKGDFITVQFFIDNPEAIPSISSTLDQRVADNRTFYERGFVVDAQGNLDLPLVGKILVENLTMLEAKTAITKSYQEYIKTPVVVLKKLSFKVTILGEVNKPGLYYIPNESMTLPEGLGMAGDLTNYGSRTDIKIFRKVNGGLQEINVDLTNRDYLNSPINYLMQDDVIYVRPLRRKALANVQPALSVISTIISSAVLIATFLIIRTN
nr:polysaccharide biosynthesis/export family protein [Bacteroidota bacterium]